MKYFGTVKSFDEVSGHGAITPETGGDDLRFERGGGVLEPCPSTAARSAPVVRPASHEWAPKRRKSGNCRSQKGRVRLSVDGAAQVRRQSKAKLMKGDVARERHGPG